MELQSLFRRGSADDPMTTDSPMGPADPRWRKPTHSKLSDRVASPLDIVKEAKAFVTWEQSSGFGAVKTGRSCKKLPALQHLDTPFGKAPRVPDSTSSYRSAPPTIEFPGADEPLLTDWSSPSNCYRNPPRTAPPRMPSGCVNSLRKDSWLRPKSSDHTAAAALGRCPASQSRSSCPRIKGEKNRKHLPNPSASSRCYPGQQPSDRADVAAPSPIILRIDLPTPGKKTRISTPSSWENQKWDSSPAKGLGCLVEDSAESHHVLSKRPPRREGAGKDMHLEAISLVTAEPARHGANGHARKSSKSREKRLERKSSKTKSRLLDDVNTDETPHCATADDSSAKTKSRHVDDIGTDKKVKRADIAHGSEDKDVEGGRKSHQVHCLGKNYSDDIDGVSRSHKSRASDDGVKKTKHQRSGGEDVAGGAPSGGGAPPASCHPSGGNHTKENLVEPELIDVRSEDDLDADTMETSPGQQTRETRGMGVAGTMVSHSVGRVYVGTHRKWIRGEMLGLGTLGIVFKAMDSETGETFAVKEVLIDDKLESDVKFSEALQREIDMFKDLKHDHIVSYLGHDTIEGKLFVYLEFMVGGSIAHVVSNFGALDEVTMATYTKHVLLGLEFLHSQNPPFLHRDIKGANVLVGIDCKAKLSDFGCSKRATDSMARTMTGSILWMAPEVMNGVGYGRKADLWSLGCLLIEMSSARHPWESFDNNVVAMVRIAMSVDIPDIPEHVSSVCKDFILACLTRDPDERPSASELLQHTFVAEVPD
eukprot:GEMP01012687.1.p1 GENE.GEMP01012687.1~~GEMP01012687.1.p1  ORF type:complete len:763 (+),score=151.37 GEMP01012687.1:51-2339(+)